MILLLMDFRFLLLLLLSFFILGYMIGKYKWMESWLSKELVQAICLILFVLFYCMADSAFVKALPMTVVQVLLCFAFFLY